MSRREDRRRPRRSRRRRRKGTRLDPTTLGVAIGLVAAGTFAVAVTLLQDRAETGPGLLAASTGEPGAAEPVAAEEGDVGEKGPRGERELELPEVGTGLRGPSFQLARVELLGLDRLEPAEILKLASLRAGMPLLDLDPQAVKDAVTSHPRVASCRAARLPPNAILVEVTERVPLAALHEGGKPSGEGLDTEGERIPLTPEESSALPGIEGDSDLALPLLRAAADSGLALARVVARGPHDVAFEPSDWKLRVRTGTDPVRAIGDWIRLVRTAQVHPHDAGEVDLRFRGRAVLRGGKGKDAGGSE